MSFPVQQSRFIGRVDELQTADELLHEHRLVTLLGAGGSGKTWLAIQIALEAAERFPDGVYWVPLAPVRDPGLVEQTIARSVGANGSLAEHFATQRLLLVLDNVGRSRHAGSIAERARLNVVRAVRTAMRRIAATDADLGAHLEATIRTGTVCAYTPDPRVDIAWRVSTGGAVSD